MPRYDLHMPFSFEAKDDRTAALVANLLAHRNALLLAEDGRVVETFDSPHADSFLAPANLLSPVDLRERGEDVVAALDTVACGFTGQRPDLDLMVEDALQHPDAQRGPWSRQAVVRTAYRRWFMNHNNQVTALVYSMVDHLVGRINDMLRDVTRKIHV